MAFKNGNITRILIRDFLTFDHAEVRPTPYLNLILGPNGTGKSTILCAVCICLGGKPDVTGRSKNLDRYVKHGKETAVVEVELYHEKGQHQIIRRQFNSTGSKWYLNGKSVLKKEIDNVIARFGIQVDNLCQFLPQDRVANFARMNPMQLLEATEKAVGEPQLFEYHELLRDSGSKMQEVKNKLTERTHQLDLLQKQNASLKAMVENLQEKEKIENEISNLQKQLMFFKYETKRKLHKEAEEKLKSLQALIKKEKEKFQPIREIISKTTDDLKSQKLRLRHEMTKFGKVTEKCNQNFMQTNKLFNRIKDLKADFQSKKEEYEQHQREVQDFKRQLDVYEQQLRNQPNLNEADVTRRIQELTRDIREASNKLANTSNEQEDIISSIKEYRLRIQNNQRGIESANDVMQQRMELLRRKNADAYKAAEWLKNNGNKFASPFYMPMCTQLNIRNPKYANAVESVISFSDLIAFTFEDKDDTNKFKAYMDKLGIRVNIVHSVPLDISQFTPSCTLEELRKWDFKFYMADLIDAPPAVLSYLYRQYRIHQIPLTHNENINYDELPSSLRNFFMGNKQVKRIPSRYDNEVLTETVTIREGSLLKITVNQELINNLQDEIHSYQEGIASAEGRMASLKQEEQSVKQDLEKWRNEKQVHTSHLEKRKELLRRIAQKQSQIKRYKEETFDLEAEEAKINEEILRMIRAIRESVTVARNDALSEPVSQIQNYYKLASTLQIMKVSIKNMEEALSSSEEELKGLEETAVRNVKEKVTLRAEAQKSLQEFYSSIGVRRQEDIPKEIITKFKESTLEETERLLMDYGARRDCMHTADEGEVRAYYERENQIKTVRKELEKLIQQRDLQHNQLEESRSRWLPSIQDLIGNISSSFTEFMERMGYAGEVELFHGEDENDYNKYGICIKVKFRRSDRLRQLTAQHQSGGERAVSTALYMMSLQNLTSVPFRCVDEINQGMDPINERLMLSMLMETAAKEETSQYFFVSPKLLPDLDYGNRVNTVIVYNGPITVPREKFKLCKTLKRRKLVNGKT